MARREHRISFRLDDDELKLFYKLLEDSTLENVSDFVRQATLTGVVKAPPPAEVKALLRALLQELRAQGNNLNQITKIMNASGFEQPEDLRELNRHNKEMLALIKNISF